MIENIYIEKPNKPNILPKPHNLIEPIIQLKKVKQIKVKIGKITSLKPIIEDK